LNENGTAPLTVRGTRVSNSLSDSTAEFALHEHAGIALNKLRLSGLAALSRDVPARALPQLRIMKAATILGEPSSITFGRAVQHAVTGDRSSYREAATPTMEHSGSPRAEPPGSMLERFVRALGGWKGLLAPDHFGAMAQHVERLLSDQEELDEDGVSPSLSSFDDLLSFLSSRPWDKAPAVGLNRRGQFSVSWTRARPHTDVTLTFLGESRVKWYVFGLGKKRNGSAAGTSDRADVIGILTQLGCDNWMGR
jgi:hypothetical protein